MKKSASAIEIDEKINMLEFLPMTTIWYQFKGNVTLDKLSY